MNNSRQDFWNTILSSKRIYGESSELDENDNRSPFDMDHDRVIYSNYFRRMHDKTQVFPYAPLSTSGQARSRLSHSLEVSCVGRSLGSIVGNHLAADGLTIKPFEIGTICATACLAHDIGNPPFGHAGEDAIKEWAKNNISKMQDNWEFNDILNFEGNAQGFRILTRLESWQRKGALKITAAMLAAFTKYPCSSLDSDINSHLVENKKHGFIKDDIIQFEHVFNEIGFKKIAGKNIMYPRHPLSFLCEAADDICYAIVDLEDAYHIGIISFDTVYNLLMPIINSDKLINDDSFLDHDIRLSRMRSAAISVLVKQVTSAFIDNMNQIESLSLHESLIKKIKSYKEYNDIKIYSFNKIYTTPKVMEIESAGFKAIQGLLSIFVPSVIDDNPTKENQINRHIIPRNYLRKHEINVIDDSLDKTIESLSKYERILSIIDYVSGMTDRYAIEIFQRLSGIKLPEY